MLEIAKICVVDGTAPRAQKARQLGTALSEALGAAIVTRDADDTRDAAAARLARLARLTQPAPAPGNGHNGNGNGAARPRAFESLAREVGEAGYDLVVIGAVQDGEDAGDPLGPTCERLLRRARTDTLVVKDPEAAGLTEPGNIVVCIDGSAQSYAGLRTALGLAKRFGKTVEAVGVYDPYLHYTLFNGIVTVLTKEAESVFKFKDQEKLHEEIIDTGLAKIYQAHLEVARTLASEAGVDLKITLLDGKAFERILKLVRKSRPWLLVLGRIGVHSDDDMDIGATSENLLRLAPCNVLVVSQKLVPRVDVQAHESVEWTPEAKAKMNRVPSFVRGVATTAILRWAIERGHSVITAKVINSAMGDLLPPSAAQAMGYVAEELAIAKDNLHEGKTYLCGHCGYAAKDYRPVACPVCKTEGAAFEEIDRQALQSLGKLQQGAIEVEETFDGAKLKWTAEAKEIIRRVPSGYQRRRTKARIEKTARVRGLDTITGEFALDMVQQDLADTSYLTPRGEALQIRVEADEQPDDEVARPREESPLPWTDAAWKRMLRVPEGFMRDMTREKVEEFAVGAGAASVNLALCEEGIAEGRRMMAEMLAERAAQKTTTTSATAKSAAEAKPAAAKPAVTAASAEPEASAESAASAQASGEPAGSRCPVAGQHASAEASAESAAPAHAPHAAPAHATHGAHGATATGAACPFSGHATEQAKAEPARPAPGVTWTPEAEQAVSAAVDRAQAAGKFDAERAHTLARGAAEERARTRRMEQIGQSFMSKLGKQLGYGHPLSELTDKYEFTWTPEALERLERVPEFCREMTRWRVEWTAVKQNLGTVITPEIMDVKFGMWGEVSGDILAGGTTLPWAPETLGRLDKIPEFVKGQVIQSVEGNARAWGCERVTDDVLDRVIHKWIETGDFHEAQYGYKADPKATREN